jgi:hypothetical protein
MAAAFNYFEGRIAIMTDISIWLIRLVFLVGAVLGAIAAIKGQIKIGLLFKRIPLTGWIARLIGAGVFVLCIYNLWISFSL